MIRRSFLGSFSSPLKVAPIKFAIHDNMGPLISIVSVDGVF